MEADELIVALHERYLKIPFIIITGKGDEQLALAMMKKGALDYITKESGFLDIFGMGIQQLWVLSLMLLNFINLNPK